MKNTFIDNLPKIYGMYTGGFIAFIILMAILEQMGLGLACGLQVGCFFISSRNRFSAATARSASS